jgi:hypothetical protein
MNKQPKTTATKECKCEVGIWYKDCPQHKHLIPVLDTKEWEFRFKNRFMPIHAHYGNPPEDITEAIIEFIREELKTERMHAEVETGLRAFPIVLEAKQEALDNYKRSLVKELEKKKKFSEARKTKLMESMGWDAYQVQEFEIAQASGIQMAISIITG